MELYLTTYELIKQTPQLINSACQHSEIRKYTLCTTLYECCIHSKLLDKISVLTAAPVTFKGTICMIMDLLIETLILKCLNCVSYCTLSSKVSDL